MEPTLLELEIVDGEELMREIARYLAAVETFRREGHEPRWSDHPYAYDL